MFIKFFTNEKSATWDLGMYGFSYYDKIFIVVGGAPLSDRTNFPKHDSKLTIRSKYGVVTGEMIRFSRRVDTKTDFIKYTIQMITKMARFKYSPRRLLMKVRSFRHWPKKLVKWTSTRRRILKLIDDIWHTQQQG